MGGPLVSILVTNRNYGRFLDESVGSALAQTYEPIEVIVVDDGSTDDSRARLAAFGDRITVIHQDRGGMAAAGAAAFRASRGEIAMFLDADDRLEPGIIARVVEEFGREPAPVLVQWRLRTIDAEGRDLNRIRPPRPGLMPSGDLRLHVLRYRNWHSQLTSGVAYRSSALGRLLPAQLPDGEVGALDGYLNDLVPLLGPVRSIDDIGGCYRAHPSGNSASAVLGAAYPHRMIALTTNIHDRVRALGADLGLDVPADPDALADPAYLGWRLWSLRIDPASHPIASDRRRTLAWRGVRAALGHPQYPWTHRLKRAGWFAVVAAGPAPLARWVLGHYTPDGPRVRAGRLVA